MHCFPDGEARGGFATSEGPAVVKRKQMPDTNNTQRRESDEIAVTRGIDYRCRTGNRRCMRGALRERGREADARRSPRIEGVGGRRGVDGQRTWRRSNAL